jgi:hypothetical protein
MVMIRNFYKTIYMSSEINIIIIYLSVITLPTNFLFLYLQH